METDAILTGSILGPCLAILVEFLKKIKLPVQWAFGIVIVFGIGAAIALQFNHGAASMFLQAVQSIIAALGSYDFAKNVNRKIKKN